MCVWRCRGEGWRGCAAGGAWSPGLERRLNPAREPKLQLRASPKLQSSAQPRHSGQSPGLKRQCPGRPFSLTDPSLSAKTFDQSLLANIPKSFPALAPGRSRSLWCQ